MMRNDTRTVRYDKQLKIEAYLLYGMTQPFPNHFHENYVIGLMEGGERHLVCRDREYTLVRGDMVLFNPEDNHACSPSGTGFLNYRAVNISKEVMGQLSYEVTGKEGLPGFFPNVIMDEELAGYFLKFHQMIMEGYAEFEKEEILLFFMDSLITKYSRPFPSLIRECREEIDMACAFMNDHYGERISLEDICDYAGLSKSTLLRAFTKSKGITPYRYLETVRINAAKKLLEQGMTPVEAALRTGFSDQSHFTNYFTMFTGLAPGVYRSMFQQEEEK
ncbi:MAG: helix-turn-helix domain-containing protein [Blautia sp.]|jgi:AraC-like DNA-binding protein